MNRPEAKMIASLVALAIAALVPLGAQMSSPTKMTLAIERGPMWGRLRTAMPAIMAGGGYKTEFAAWNIAASLDRLGGTFFEALDTQEPLFVMNVEAAASQVTGGGIDRRLTYDLSADQIEAVKQKLAAAKVRMVGLDVPQLNGDEAEARRVFQFARTLNVETIVAAPPPDALPAIDQIANEFGMNLAIVNGRGSKVRSYADPKSLMAAIAGRSNRIGACIDAETWMEDKIVPADGLSILGDRAIAVRFSDRDAIGSAAQGNGPANRSAVAAQFLDAMYRLGTNPTFISIRYSGSGDPVADMSKAFAGFESALQPIAADRVDRISKVTPIRGPERLQEKDRNAVIAAAASVSAVPPKKGRKLLVLDLNIAYPGHGSIPAANLAIKLWAEKTGVYTPVFDNNLDNLKYSAIKQFDAVFLNNTVGQVFPDPAVREGLLRYVNEGGGLGAYHGTPHASMDWQAFGDMLAARGGSHRDFNEKAVIRIEDPKNPVTAAFDGQEFEWQDEFFRFTTPPWSRDKVHVLLSFDNARTDLHQKPDCDICNRADDDYPVSWIRSYGKGRIFYTTLGHRPALFENPLTSRFVLAGIQFILGDLDADTTPGTRPAEASPQTGR